MDTDIKSILKDASVKFYKESEGLEPVPDVNHENTSMSPEYSGDDILNTAFEFFNLNQMIEGREKREKVSEIVEWFSKEYGIDSPGEMYKRLARLSQKLGSRDVFDTDIERVYRYIKIKKSVQSMNQKVEAMEGIA
jgi:hypothetical protein